MLKNVASGGSLAGRSRGAPGGPPKNWLFQIPDKSGFPSGVRGAGADRLALPSGVRGTLALGCAGHCAESTSGTAMRNANVPTTLRHAFISISKNLFSCEPLSQRLHTGASALAILGAGSTRQPDRSDDLAADLEGNAAL